jgi:hypothetical protein
VRLAGVMVCNSAGVTADRDKVGMVVPSSVCGSVRVVGVLWRNSAGMTVDDDKVGAVATGGGVSL